MSRWFVIGNGPSLNNTPLDGLIGENTIAMNRIHLIYDRVKWRPTIYVKIDYNPHLKDVWQENVLLHLRMGIPCYLWAPLRDGLPEGHPNHDILKSGVGEWPNAVWVPHCEHAPYRGDNVKAVKEWHLPEICTALSKISAAMQIAVLNGATSIYLVGCDIKLTDGNDHFKEDYMPESGHRAELSEQTEQNFIYAHKLAKKSCPVPIYNATVGGYLELYKRVNIFDLLNIPEGTLCPTKS